MYSHIIIIECLYFIDSILCVLGSYNVDLGSISVSGISSGACMATQLHVAFSSTFMGSGIVAGGK